MRRGLIIAPTTSMWYYNHMCASIMIWNFVYVTQCVFSKLMQDEGGNTPLIQACQRGHVETARVLLKHGAKVDQQDNVSSIIL